MPLWYSEKLQNKKRKKYLVIFIFIVFIDIFFLISALSLYKNSLKISNLINEKKSSLELKTTNNKDTGLCNLNKLFLQDVNENIQFMNIKESEIFCRFSVNTNDEYFYFINKLSDEFNIKEVVCCEEGKDNEMGVFEVRMCNK